MPTHRRANTIDVDATYQPSPSRRTGRARVPRQSTSIPAASRLLCPAVGKLDTRSARTLVAHGTPQQRPRETTRTRASRGGTQSHRGPHTWPHRGAVCPLSSVNVKWLKFELHIPSCGSPDEQAHHAHTRRRPGYGTRDAALPRHVRVHSAPLMYTGFRALRLRLGLY